MLPFATKVHSITKHAKLHTQTISVLLSNIGDFIPNNSLESKFLVLTLQKFLVLISLKYGQTTGEDG
jgi:hypothetical protein